MRLETGKIYSLGFDADLIRLLTDALLEENEQDGFDFSKTAIVFPGKRPQFYLQKALAGRINKAFLPARVFSIEEFIQYLAKKNFYLQKARLGYCPLSLIDACFLIHRVIKSLNLSYLDWQKHLEFEHFFLWGRKMLQFLEDLDKELVTEKQLLNLQDNAQIGLPLPDYINLLLENINKIHKEFHRQLEQDKLATMGFNYYQAAQSIDKLGLDEFERIYFTGFFALCACEKKIIKYLLDQNKASIIWQQDEDNWPILEDLQGYFGIKPEVIKAKKASRVKIQIYEGFDTHSQMEAARQALGKIKDLQNACVVLPQAGALMPLLYQALPADLTDYNISLGYPLIRTPIYALVDTIMQAQEKRRKNLSFYTKDYLKVMMHPYVKNLCQDSICADATRILVHKIEETLLGMDKTQGSEKKVFIKLEEIEDNAVIFQQVSGLIRNSGIGQVSAQALREHIRLIHKTCLCAFDNCESFLDFARTCQELIYFILEKSRISSDIFGAETVNRFLAVLDELAHSLFKDELIGRQTNFFQLLKSVIFLEKIPFRGTPVGGLQILGLLETRNLKFDNLVILDLNEGVLPGVGRSNSLVPEGIFPMLGIAHYHKKEQIIRYHFRRLLSCAKQAALIYGATSKGKESRSRFIEEVIWQQEKKDGKIYDQKQIKRIEFKVASTKEDFCLNKLPQTVKLLRQSVFSPTSLDTYLNCPAKFYFRYCLGLREKEDLTDQMQASDIGNLLHSLLKEFYSSFLNKEVKLDEASRKHLFELKEKKLKEFFSQATGERFLLSKIIDHKLNIFFDQQARAGEKVRILYLEQALPIESKSITIDTEYGPAYLRGQLDRVDERISAGKRRIVILDYKTGKYSLPQKNIDCNCLDRRQDIKKAIGSFQLPLYIYLFSQFRKNTQLSDLQASFYSLREMKERFLFDGKNGSDLLQIYIGAARKLLSQILSADFDFQRDDSNEDYCKFCAFAGLCKR